MLQHGEDDDDDVLQAERQRLQGLDIHNGASAASLPDNSATTPGPPSLSALDAVLLPVLDQLSLAVAQRPDAQHTIDAIRRSFQEAEMLTPGLMNAFAVEVYHGIAEAQADVQGVEYDGEEEDEEDDPHLAAPHHWQV